jgi:hypothetical protein
MVVDYDNAMESRRWSLSCEDFDCPSIILPLSFAQND